jgi:hypothetical protein
VALLHHGRLLSLRSTTDSFKASEAAGSLLVPSGMYMEMDDPVGCSHRLFVQNLNYIKFSADCFF